MPLWSLGPEQSADDPGSAQFGLAWLIPLWVDRDLEVRHTSTLKFASLYLACTFIFIHLSQMYKLYFCQMEKKKKMLAEMMNINVR